MFLKTVEYLVNSTQTKSKTLEGVLVPCVVRKMETGKLNSVKDEKFPS